MMFEQDIRDAPTVVELSHRFIKAARKSHKCDGCREPINKGDRYQRIVCIYDGEFEVSRYHGRCYG